ncbi:MAG: lipid II:glycine glycyltransferase FemX [Chthoniobacterales bacterium]
MAQQRRWKYCELRGGDWIDGATDPAVTFYGHTLQLSTDPEKVFVRFSNGTRGAVKQATKNGVIVEISRDRQAMCDFYALQVQTRKKHGVPPQPASFFDNVHEKMIEGGFGFISLAKFEGRTVAGAVFLATPKRAVYKFAASDSDSIHSRGNHLVLWEAIRHLIVNGCEQLHFGRTSPDNAGLRNFKLSWGAEEEMISYTRFDTKQRHWLPVVRHEGEGMSNRISRALPSAVNRFAGEILYPHLD